ncbi:MAG: hypothetical protein RR413_02405 [Christensenellaceae bacterium]
MGDEAMIRAQKLKKISINATGYDKIEIEKANKRHIGVSPVGEYCAINVEVHTIDCC